MHAIAPVPTVAALDPTRDASAAPRVAHAEDVPARQHADPVAQTFFELLTVLHQDEYTGVLVLHLAQGVPKVAEIPEQVITRRQVRLR